MAFYFRSYTILGLCAWFYVQFVICYEWSVFGNGTQFWNSFRRPPRPRLYAYDLKFNATLNRSGLAIGDCGFCAALQGTYRNESLHFWLGNHECYDHTITEYGLSLTQECPWYDVTALGIYPYNVFMNWFCPPVIRWNDHYRYLVNLSCHGLNWFSAVDGCVRFDGSTVRTGNCVIDQETMFGLSHVVPVDNVTFWFTVWTPGYASSARLEFGRFPNNTCWLYLLIGYLPGDWLGVLHNDSSYWGKHQSQWLGGWDCSVVQFIIEHRNVTWGFDSHNLCDRSGGVCLLWKNLTTFNVSQIDIGVNGSAPLFRWFNGTASRDAVLFSNFELSPWRSPPVVTTMGPTLSSTVLTTLLTTTTAVTRSTLSSASFVVTTGLVKGTSTAGALLTSVGSTVVSSVGSTFFTSVGTTAVSSIVTSGPTSVGGVFTTLVLTSLFGGVGGNVTNQTRLINSSRLFGISCWGSCKPFGNSTCVRADGAICCTYENSTTCDVYDPMSNNSDSFMVIILIICLTLCLWLLLKEIVKCLKGCWTKKNPRETHWSIGDKNYSTRNWCLMVLLALICGIRPSQQIVVAPPDFGVWIMDDDGFGFSVITMGVYVNGSYLTSKCCGWTPQAHGSISCCASTCSNPHGQCSGSYWGAGWNDGCFCENTNCVSWSCDCVCQQPFSVFGFDFGGGVLVGVVKLNNGSAEMTVSINHTGTTRTPMANISVSGCDFGPYSEIGWGPSGWYDVRGCGGLATDGRPLGGVTCSGRSDWGNVDVDCDCPPPGVPLPPHDRVSLTWRGGGYPPFGVRYIGCDWTFDWYIKKPVNDNCTWYVRDCWTGHPSSTCEVVVTGNSTCTLFGTRTPPGSHWFPCVDCTWHGRKANGSSWDPKPVTARPDPFHPGQPSGASDWWHWFLGIWTKYLYWFVVLIVLIVILFLFCSCRRRQ